MTIMISKGKKLPNYVSLTFSSDQKDFGKHNRENHAVKPEKIINCDKCTSSFNVPGRCLATRVIK